MAGAMLKFHRPEGWLFLSLERPSRYLGECPRTAFMPLQDDALLVEVFFVNETVACEWLAAYAMHGGARSFLYVETLDTHVVANWATAFPVCL